MSKEYGLIIPNKNKNVLTPSAPSKRASIFDEDSDSDPDSAKPTGLTRTIKRQDRVVQERAVEEDPTVYQYDEIYDEMDQKRKESKLSRKDLDKKPKYINKLLVAADRRKRENERRIERQVQKEREAEGEEFKDKESFVTAAYKKKLEEMKELEEQEKREEYLESIGDVRKQGNLDGFYRHLYDQKVNLNDADVKDMKKTADEEVLKKTVVEEETEVNKESETKHLKKQNVRRYRKREDSKSEEEGGQEDTEKVHLASNLDADSDFSIDSESDEEDKVKGEENKVAVKVEKEDEVDDKNEVKQVKEEVKVEDVAVEVKPKKPKIDIWKKRTVGIVFDEALQRYYERKAMRESG